MVNVSVNSSTSATEDVSDIIGTTTIDGVLLLIVFIATVLNVIVIAALIGKDTSELVLSIRVILVNILAACVLGATGEALYHISSPILRLSSSATDHGPALCRASVFIVNTSNTGRILFTAFYGVAVFLAVHFWNRPVLAPRNTKYFITASVLVWMFAVAVGIPALVAEEVVTGVCSSNSTQDTQSISSRFTLFVTLPYLIVSCIPIIVTPIILIDTSCYIKRKTIRENRNTKIALVKFGVFLMIVQGVNAFAQIAVPLLALGISSLQKEFSLAFTVAVALSGLTQIPTSVLILLFFKPVRYKVQRWICCCSYHGHKQASKSTSRTIANYNSTTVGV